MKISLNWIGDFIDIDADIPSSQLAKDITMAVCEIEGVEETGTHLKDVVVAEVLEIKPHPSADKLTLVTVNYGKNTQEVVCGAKNIKPGDKIPYAGLGTELPGGFKIKKAKIRGIESEGMLCAEDELGFSDDHEGIMILPEDSIVGTPLSAMYPDQVDVILEVDNKSITHRPDLWGHYGFARELGVVYKKAVKKLNLNTALLKGEGESPISVEVKNAELVPRFSGLSITAVDVKPSPAVIRHRLFRVGLRAINNLVDLTNYVMLEYGQPMHAFDADRIPGNKLTVKLADDGTKLMTLYDKEVTLTPNDLGIYDSNGISTVAGVIGGLDSGINEQTKTIFLEAANWNPVTVRKTSTRIGIRTDALQRFEKSLDPEMTTMAIQRSVELLKDSVPNIKVKGDLIDIRGKEIPPITIKTSFEFICRRLGKAISSEEILDTLQRLDFDVTENAGDLTIQVPSHRRTKDVSIPEDIVEEIGRVHGFNNIDPASPLFPIKKTVFNLEHRFTRLTKAILCKTGFHEVVNYPLTAQKEEDSFNISAEGTIRIKNPVSDHQVQMRKSLLPHFLKTIQNNQKITPDFKIFETGRIYSRDAEGTLKETEKLIIGISKTKETIGGSFYQLKSQLSNLLAKLQIPKISLKPLSNGGEAHQHNNISAEIYSKATCLGRIYALSPEHMDAMGIKHDICIAEMDFDVMFEIEKKEYEYKAPPKFPAVHFELSLLVPKRTFSKEVCNMIKSYDRLIVSAGYLNEYYPEDMPEMKSLSLSIEFQSENKTLDSEEVTQLQNKVINKLAEAGYNLR